jgi:hypothetical protein
VAQEKFLKAVTADIEQEAALKLGFNFLGDDREVHGFAEGNDGLCDSFAGEKEKRTRPPCERRARWVET